LRYGFEPYDTESSARRVAEQAAAELADLLAALQAILEQATGPAAIYGDGCGSDGKKTGLSHWEFNELRDKRIAQARAAIARMS
jgi:hypothetical protein